MRYTIEVLTPIHIFDRRLQPFEVVQAPKGRLGVLSEEKLARLLGDAGLIRDFCRKALEGRIDVLAFMKEHHLEDRLGEALIRTIETPGNTGPGSIQGAVVDGVSQEPYLPGSSIKGCLRNALLFGLLRAHERTRTDEGKRIRAEIDRAAGDKRRLRALRERIGKPVDSLLQQTQVDGAGATGPHTDWLRAVQVTDAHLDGSSRMGSSGPTRLYLTGVVSIRRDPRSGADVAVPKPGLQIAAEALKPGTTLSGRLNVDAGLLDWLRPRGTGRRPFTSADELMRRLEEFSEDVIDSEIAFFEGVRLPALAKRMKELRGGANIRIGWGGGYLARTVALAFDPDLRQSVRDAFYQPRTGVPFPKSRKVIMDGSEPADVLGWARMTLGG